MKPIIITTLIATVTFNAATADTLSVNNSSFDAELKRVNHTLATMDAKEQFLVSTVDNHNSRLEGLGRALISQFNGYDSFIAAKQFDQIDIVSEFGSAIWNTKSLNKNMGELSIRIVNLEMAETTEIVEGMTDENLTLYLVALRL